MSTGPILVVDDDPAMRDLLSTSLSATGYDVEIATNGVEALQAVERARPALVLLDLQMPVLDGWGFVRQLTTRGVTLPIVIITSRPDARRCAQEIGAVGYLTKPFAMPELLAAVNACAPPA